jgi:hypothetical protein
MGRGAWKKGNFADTAQRWGTGYQNSGANLTKGIQNPKQSPTAGAIANVAAMAAGINNALSGGDQSIWANALRRSGDGAWKAGMALYAQSGLAAKATKGVPHYLAFAQQYGPAVVSYAAQLPPRGDFGANQNRAIMMMQFEHASRGKFRKLWRQGG